MLTWETTVEAGKGELRRGGRRGHRGAAVEVGAAAPPPESPRASPFRLTASATVRVTSAGLRPSRSATSFRRTTRGLSMQCPTPSRRPAKPATVQVSRVGDPPAPGPEPASGPAVDSEGKIDSGPGDPIGGSLQVDAI